MPCLTSPRILPPSWDTPTALDLSYTRRIYIELIADLSLS
jgi:hypothetical protein